MSNATDADIQALIAELKVLRADFTKITEIVKDAARHGSAEAAERIREHAERGWDQASELTPIKRYAEMFSGAGLSGVDGTAWYHPLRLTIDAGAVVDGNRNPAQRVLGVRATHGDEVDVPIYAFGAALGGTRVLSAARTLARQSHLPRRDLTLVDRHTTYAHNDPAGAFPKNDFLSRLLTFLRGVDRAGARSS